MLQIHIIQHEPYVKPGAFQTWAMQRGHAIHITKCWKYEPIPTSAEGIDLLLILGGPQCAATTQQECPYFCAEDEKAIIRTCISAGKIVLGICLGAQLIGEALGAPYQHSPEKEIGPVPITLTPAGREDPFWQHLSDGDFVGEWHNDMPGLTPESKVLAYSKGCPRQIIAYGRFVYGLQCHMEFTNELHAELIQSMSGDFTGWENHPFIQAPDDILAFDCTPMNQKLMQFLDALVSAWTQ